MPRWFDLSEHGVVIRLAGDGEARQLVLESLDRPVREADAKALGFSPEADRFVRPGTQIGLREVQAVYPKASIREFSDSELRATATTTAIASDAPPVAGAEAEQAAGRAARMSPAAFAQAATFRKRGDRWHVALDGAVLDIGEAAGIDTRKNTPTPKLIAAAHAHLVDADCRRSPHAGGLAGLCAHPKQAYPGSLSRGRAAEIHVMKLLADLGIADELMEGDDAHIKIRNQPYKDLVIERHHSSSAKFPEGDLFLTHYSHGNGDTWIDAEMVFGIAFGRLWFRETATLNPFNGGESRAPDRPFANLFAKNLRDQGFGQGQVIRDACEIDPTAGAAQVLVTSGITLTVQPVRMPDGWASGWQLDRGDSASGDVIVASEQFPIPKSERSARDACLRAGVEAERRLLDVQALGEALDVQPAIVSELRARLEACTVVREDVPEAAEIDAPGCHP